MPTPLILKSFAIETFINHHCYMDTPSEMGVCWYLKLMLPNPQHLKMTTDGCVIDSDDVPHIQRLIHQLCDHVCGMKQPFGYYFETERAPITLSQQLLNIENDIADKQQKKYELLDALQLIDLQLQQLKFTKQQVLNGMAGNNHD